jgi:hypothetical protein
MTDVSKGILKPGFDEKTINDWKAAGRPLPWLDAELGDDALAVDAVVAEARSIAVV